MEDQKKTMKQRFEDFKTEMSWKRKEAQAWVRDNKDALIAIGIFVVPPVLKLTQTAIVHKNDGKEERRKSRSVYDPQHHHSYTCRRDLKSYEWAEIDRRRDAGESVYDILLSMRLL